MIAFALLLVSLQPTPAQADPVAAAESAYANGDYDDAAEKFGALYEETGDPVNQYRQAQALRLGGRDGEAADAYEAFITEANTLLPTLDEATRETITLMIGNAEVQARGCRERAEPEPEPEPELEPEPEPEPEPSPPPARVDPPAPQPLPAPVEPRADPLEIGLWTSGALTTAAGIALVATATFRSNAAPSDSHDAWVQQHRSARIQQGVGFGVLGVGGALLTGAIVRTVILRRRSGGADRARAGL